MIGLRQEIPDARVLGLENLRENGMVRGERVFRTGKPAVLEPVARRFTACRCVSL